MHKKYIALIIAIALVNQVSGFNTDNMKENHSYDYHHTKTDERKLEILKKELEDLTNIEKKLILNEDHMPTTKICFWTALGSASVAAIAQVVLNGDPKKNVQQAAGIMAVASAILGVGSSVNQGYVLHNLNDQKKQTLNSINSIK